MSGEITDDTAEKINVLAPEHFISQETKETVQEVNGKAQSPEASSNIDKLQSLKKRRREARNALKEAWCEREASRLKVIGTWSLEGLQVLQRVTRSYNAQRMGLARLMPDGLLNEEDAKLYPEFSETNLIAPKFRPPGFQDLRKKLKAEEAKLEVTQNKEQPDPDADIDTLTEQMRAAKTVREQAIAFRQSGKPKGKASYQTWKAHADGKLERATKFYLKKRVDLLKAFPEGLPDELLEKYPEL